MLRRLARAKDVGLIYSNTIGVLPGMIAARTLSLPSIIHVHEIIEKPRLVGVLLATLAKALATRVVAVSGPVKENLDHDALVRRDRVVVIHNGISTERFDTGEQGGIRAQFGIDAGTLLIAMVGRLHFWKGQDFLLDAAAILRSRGVTDFRILFFGDVYPGYEDLRAELRVKTQSLGLQDNCVFAGYRDDAHRLFLDADVVVLPSTLPDPLPTVVLEAMAARKAVVATAHGGALEMVADGDTGFLVSPTDPREMAESLLTLASDTRLREDMGRRGRERLERLFSERRFADEIRALIADTGRLVEE
jgi:glycosyltransferase involved in cell wall biosynthesis